MLHLWLGLKKVAQDQRGTVDSGSSPGAPTIEAPQDRRTAGFRSGSCPNGMVQPCSGPVIKGSWQGAPKTRSTLSCDQLLCETSVSVNEARRPWNGETKWRA